MEREPFVVDLNNPDDMRAKLAEAEGKVAAYDEQLEAMRDIERARDDWKTTADFLRLRVGPTDGGRDAAPLNGTMAPQPNASEPAAAPASEQAPVVWELAAEVVNREVRKIRSIEVCKILNEEGHAVSANSVSNALYYATHKAKVVKPALGRGMYAPLAYEENFDSAKDEPVSTARPEEPYSAPEEEDRAEAPGDPT